MAKSKSLSETDVGTDPVQIDAETDPAQAEAEAEAKAEAETKPALIRHKTQYQKYRCAGLVLTQKTETYQVTKLQFLKLRCDPWVEVKEVEAK
jgi:hypothetical protein